MVMLTPDEQARLAAIRARLAEERALTEQLSQLQNAPIEDYWDAENRGKELGQLRMQRWDIRAHYADDVVFLLQLVERLAAEQGTAARGEAE